MLSVAFILAALIGLVRWTYRKLFTIVTTGTHKFYNKPEELPKAWWRRQRKGTKRTS